jgi:hypothetical protein
VTQHQQRFICDNFVYDQNFGLLQTMETSNVASGCVLTQNLVVLGHTAYGDMTVLIWNDDE